MPRVIIYPYRMGSRSARDLKDNIVGRRCLLVREQGRYIPRPTDVAINWGNPRIPNWNVSDTGVFLNVPTSVAMAGNKLQTAQCFEQFEVSQPAFTTDPRTAQNWLNEGNEVMARELLRASGGRGLRHVFPGQELGPAQMYAKYVKKIAEYRIHVFGGQIIDAQQKRRRNGFEDVDNKIRNHENGWVFCRGDLEVPDCVLDTSRMAIRALALDFGAVDVIYNQYYDRAYALEVNTAPGLEGTTLYRYVEAITGLLEE